MADGGKLTINGSLCEGHNFKALVLSPDKPPRDPEVFVVIDEATRYSLGYTVKWNGVEYFSQELAYHRGRQVRLQRLSDGFNEKLLCRAGDDEFELVPFESSPQGAKRLQVDVSAVNDNAAGDNLTTHSVMG